jgi:hypothetical protein
VAIDVTSTGEGRTTPARCPTAIGERHTVAIGHTHRAGSHYPDMSNPSLEPFVSEEQPRIDGTAVPAYPGKRSLTQSIGPSINAVADRVASVLQRRADGAASVANDSAAESAVASASSSAGAPLRSDVREKFESSLGADLSAVRVHTGEESAAAAKSVGAQAYATGNDIHFAAGRYQPDDPFGMHLLAHEVAHTVQQSRSGAPTRQNKLEVSSPGDAAEHEADRAAEAMVVGAPASVGRGALVGNAPIMRSPADAPASAASSAPAVYSLPGKTMPFNAQPITTDVNGLYHAITETGAFEKVPPEDPLFATLSEFASVRKWQIPTEAITTSVQTSRWGMQGKWRVTVTPTLMGEPIHRGPSGKMKVTAGDASAHSSGGTLSSTAELGGELAGGEGARKAAGKVTDASGATHGASRTGTGGTEQEYESQKFDCGMLFSVDIVGGWEEGATLSAVRVFNAAATLGISEAVRPDERRHWTGQYAGRYMVSVPTDACKKL